VVIPSVGMIVLVPFPFSDLSEAKLRPAVVLADAVRDDWILCQITSNRYGDSRAIELVNADLVAGSFRFTSYARPGKLFTASRSLMVGQIGGLRAVPFQQVLDAVVALLQRSRA
jgi:mRNA interferase MazF